MNYDTVALRSLETGALLWGVSLNITKEEGKNYYKAEAGPENAFYYFADRITNEDITEFRNFRMKAPSGTLTIILNDRVPLSKPFWKKEVFGLMAEHCLAVPLSDIPQAGSDRSGCEIETISKDALDQIARDGAFQGMMPGGTAALMTGGE